MRIIYLLLVTQLLFTKVYAQFYDSLSFRLGTTTTIANRNHQPLWISANRFGTINNQQADLSNHIRIRNKHLLVSTKQQNINSNLSEKASFIFEYVVDVYHNNHFQNVLVQEAYVKAGYKTLEIQSGRYEEITGEIDPELSSGSFGISGNALPIPKTGIYMNKFTPVPYTKGWLHFKGQLSHGWLGNTNFLKGAFLHQKSFYLKAGKKRFQFYGGLNHFAQWGGVNRFGKAPDRFKDFLRIVVGAKGDGSDPVYQQGPIDIANAVGNHLIVPDFGVALNTSKSSFKVYTQTIFERGVADSANQRDRLSGLKLFSRDRLIGFNWKNNKNTLIQKIVLEGIYTKYQGGPIIFQGRDNYYNNATYQTGWEYQGRIIGTPLFINRQNAAYLNLDTDVNSLGGWNIVSNRIKGIHLGLKGYIGDKLSYRVLATYVQHYGNYYNDAIFAPYKAQSHTLYESSYQLNKAFILTTAIGYDFGDLTKSTGVLFKLEWNLKG